MIVKGVDARLVISGFTVGNGTVQECLGNAETDIAEAEFVDRKSKLGLATAKGASLSGSDGKIEEAVHGASRFRSVEDDRAFAFLGVSRWAGDTGNCEETEKMLSSRHGRLQSGPCGRMRVVRLGYGCSGNRGTGLPCKPELPGLQGAIALELVALLLVADAAAQIFF